MMAHNMQYVNIFTDGSCSGNPGPGGWSVVFDKCNRIKQDIHSLLILSGGEENTTNNRMELMAILKAIKIRASNSLFKDYVFSIFSDSAYCINIIKSGLLDYWATKTNFKTIRGNDVSNNDLWKELYPLLKELRENKHIELHKIKGHHIMNYIDNNNNMNPIADAAAKEMTKIFKEKS